MAVGRDKLVKIVKRAWNEARQRADCLSSEPAGYLHRRRSEAWVDELAKGFRQEYDSECHRVFWKHNWDNRSEFYRNEFLFDVTVARVATVESLERTSRKLLFIAECEWVVESELDNRNSRQVVVDMSKLVMAASKNKLFIASPRRQGTDEDMLCRYSSIAEHCSGNVYFCLVAHPVNWDDNPGAPSLFEWRTESRWYRLGTV